MRSQKIMPSAKESEEKTVDLWWPATLKSQNKNLSIKPMPICLSTSETKRGRRLCALENKYPKTYSNSSRMSQFRGTRSFQTTLLSVVSREINCIKSNSWLQKLLHFRKKKLSLGSVITFSSVRVTGILITRIFKPMISAN